jgi:hypothetical protein
MWKIKSHGELVMECDNVTLLAPADGFNKFFRGQMATEIGSKK